MIIQNKDRSTNPKKQYKADKQAINSEIKSHTMCLNHAIEDLNRAQETYGFNSNEYNAAFIQTERWRYCIEENNLALKFVRPNNQNDIEYRINQYNEFTEKLQSVISKNLDLRFHGTPIYFAEQIIKTKTITSTADRYNGYRILQIDMANFLHHQFKHWERRLNYFQTYKHIIVHYHVDVYLHCFLKEQKIMNFQT